MTSRTSEVANELRIGLSGTGRIGQRVHIPALRRIEGATLIAVTHDHGILERFDRVVDFADFLETS